MKTLKKKPKKNKSAKQEPQKKDYKVVTTYQKAILTLEHIR